VVERWDRERRAPAISRSAENSGDLSHLTEQLASKRYDFLGHSISLLTIFTHARAKLKRYVSIPYAAMDILQELHKKSELPPSLCKIAVDEKGWKNDEGLRREIVRLGEQIMLDCEELGIIERERSEFHETEYVISELGLRLARQVNATAHEGPP